MAIQLRVFAMTVNLLRLDGSLDVLLCGSTWRMLSYEVVVRQLESLRDGEAHEPHGRDLRHCSGTCTRLA